MISFGQPSQLNGLQLVDELAEEGIIVTGFPLIDADGLLWLQIDETHKAKTQQIIANHVGLENYEDARTQAKNVLLKRLGITAEEAELLK